MDLGFEESLLVGLRRGNVAALGATYETHKNAVLSAAVAVLGRDAAAEAWDVLHDVFVGLGRSAKTLRPDTSLRAYLVRSAVNRANDRHTRRRRNGAASANVLALRRPPPPPPLDQMMQRETTNLLWQALHELPAEQRRVVALRIWGRHSFVEIGKLEGVGENTAQSRWRYALEKLRAGLREVDP